MSYGSKKTAYGARGGGFGGATVGVVIKGFFEQLTYTSLDTDNFTAWADVFFDGFTYTSGDVDDFDTGWI